MSAKLAPGSTSAIGSLPHTDAASAVDFVISSGCDIPAWPQLPKRDVREWMVPQFAGFLPGFTLDEQKKSFRIERTGDYIEKLTAFYERALEPAAQFPFAESDAAGFYAFLERMKALREKVETGRGLGEKRLEEAQKLQKEKGGSLGEALVEMGEVSAEELRSARPRFVKGQVTGPLTLLLGINMDDGRPIRADDELRQAGMIVLKKNAAWQAKALKPLAREGVVIFMDEPIYSALGTPAYLSIKSDEVRSTVNELARAVRDEGALVGIHCCGSADWEAVLSTEIDVLSFDAWSYFDTLAIYSDAVRDFLDRGGYLAWGIVPTSEDLAGVDEEAVAKKLDQEVDELVERGIDAGKLRRQSIFTPSCGCGSRTVEETEKVFRLLGAVRRHWRSKL